MTSNDLISSKLTNEVWFYRWRVRNVFYSVLLVCYDVKPQKHKKEPQTGEGYQYVLVCVKSQNKHIQRCHELRNNFLKSKILGWIKIRTVFWHMDSMDGPDRTRSNWWYGLRRANRDDSGPNGNKKFSFAVQMTI